MRLLLLTSILLLSLSDIAQKSYLFVGTYTEKNDSKGIYVYQFDNASGDARPVSTVFTDNPSYLAIAQEGNFVYAVNETHGAKPGGVSAFSFDSKTGQLKFIDKQESGGDDPCYVSVDSHHKWLMVANYSGGSLSALPIQSDGSLLARTQTIRHTGAGPNKQRQEKAHVHSVTFSPDEKYLLAADLGMDELSVYRFDAIATSEPLKASRDSIVRVQPGSGPRHISFYPGRPYVYLLNELGGAVDAYRYSDGRLTPFQHISSHPEGYTGEIGSADIHITPNGKFLYASNRGDANSIAIYSIDAATGRLQIKGFQSTRGKTPRNFMIDPTGRWLLVANQNSGNIFIFRINKETGLLEDTGKSINIPSPVCLKMMAAE
ncbi:MAG TPA: lactonase family protein [Puia sp.]|nr:lactonase family protein [Puia sp.]